MHPLVTLVAGAAAIVVSAVGAHYLSKDARAARRLLRLRVHTISDFPDGAVGRIAGRVEDGSEPLYAPLSDRVCACYELIIETQGDEHDAVWGAIHREVKVSRFRVTDATGTASMDAADAIVWLSTMPFVVAGEGADDRLRALLTERDLMNGQLPNRPLRMRESILANGDNVSVGGLGHWEPVPATLARRAYRETATQLVLRAIGRRTPLLIDGVGHRR